MADEAETTSVPTADQAAEALLKMITKWAPKVGTSRSLLDLAEAYALVTGKVASRGPSPAPKG